MLPTKNQSPATRVAIFSLLLALCLPLSASDAKPEIEALLASIKNLKGAAFIRNGESFPPEKAESHLRSKWKSAGAHVKTAEDFIALCATKSSFSGKLYVIRLADGTEVESAKFLNARLTEVRQGK